MTVSGPLDFAYRYRLWLLGTLAGALVLAVVSAAFSYLVYPSYLDHGEPSVALISWRLLDGFSAYPPFEALNRTSNVYGPITYLIHAVSYLIAGPSVAAGKASGLAAAALVPIILFLNYRRHGSETGLFAASLGAGFILLNLHVSIWNRPDPFLVLLAVLSIWAKNASRSGQPEWAKTLFIGVCGGLAVGLKVHGALYIAPIAFIQCLDRQQKFFPFVACAAVGAAVVLAPFALPVFSLGDLLAWFGVMLKAKESPVATMVQLLRYGSLYLVPLVIFALAWKKTSGKARVKDGAYAGIYLACMAMVIFLGSKPGTGKYYLYPLFPIAIDLLIEYGRRVSGLRKVVMAITGIYFVAVLFIGIPVQKRYYRSLHWQEAEEIKNEIQDIMAHYPGHTIEMGVGENNVTYERTAQRTRLVFSGHPYTIDNAIMVETSMLKIPLSDKTIDHIRRCSTDIYLIPKGEKPFTMTGYYGTVMFGQAFRDAFNTAYEKKIRFRNFDAWMCRKKIKKQK